MADSCPPTPCAFDVAYRGRCGKPSTNGWCSEHEHLMCRGCGKKATTSCDRAGTFVCGTPLCGTCRHSLIGDSHVTREVYEAQVADRNREQEETEKSRTSSVQRLDADGNPINLFELLKRNPEDQGYKLEVVHFLELDHGLAGFFPAVIDTQKRVVLCSDRGLLIEVWRTLIPRYSSLRSRVCYVNREKGIAFGYAEDVSERERSRQEKILTRREYTELSEVSPAAITWAPGLIQGGHITAEGFSRHIDQVAAQH